MPPTLPFASRIVIATTTVSVAAFLASSARSARRGLRGFASVEPTAATRRDRA